MRKEATRRNMTWVRWGKEGPRRGGEVKREKKGDSHNISKIKHKKNKDLTYSERK